jgi:NTP pyrophosphatase (non-canonical NTP hydrolase)
VDLDNYQGLALLTAVYPGKTEKEGLAYAALGLAGEAGEIANKIKKILRGDKTIDETRKDLRDELGDVLWYISALADNLDLNLSYIAEENIRKLKSRQERGVLKGSGDNR